MTTTTYSNLPRVVITGLGVVSPIGIGVDAFWDSLRNGRSGIARISSFDPEPFSTQIAGEVNDFVAEDFVDKKLVKRSDRVIHFALAASQLAVEHAKLDLDQCDRERVGVVIGTGIGGMSSWEEQHSNLITKGPRRISPFFIPMMIPGAGEPGTRSSARSAYRG